MISHSMLFLLVLSIAINAYSGQFITVSIKSHNILTKGIESNLVNAIYDNNPDTSGLFYSSKEQIAEVEFDLGKNYLIDHVVIKKKREDSMYGMSLSVGNILNKQGKLVYGCERSVDAGDVYKCQPTCRLSNRQQPGIIARQFILKLLVPPKWISIYDIQVYSLPVSESDDISSNRVLLPLNCVSSSWSTITQTIPDSQINATTTPIDIFFEKQYIITEIGVEFRSTAPKTLELVMVSSENQNNTMVISLNDCQSQKSLFTCTVKEKTFSSRYVRLQTVGVTRLSIRGKPVFYPKLEMRTSIDDTEKLRMFCEYNPCDLSVHNDCTDKAINTGVKFDCVNKQLIKQPSSSDSDSFIVVNNGKVESYLQGTKFTVEENTNSRMVVSMPRSYQYFGQYRCDCVTSDKISTAISSDVTQLKETDFLQELIFDSLAQYKTSDSENARLFNVTNNIIYTYKSAMEANFLAFRVSLYSLIPDNNIVAIYNTNEQERETSNPARSSIQKIKAFKSIPQSWNVLAIQYEIDEVYLDMLHNYNISIQSNNTKLKRSEVRYITMLDGDIVKTKPLMLFTNDGKQIDIKVIYANNADAMLVHSEKTCSGSSKKVLANFTDKNCVANDSRVSCVKFDKASLLEFKDDINFAKNVTIELTSGGKVLNDVFLKSNVLLSQNDVVIKPRYTSLVSNSKGFSVVKVDFDIISTKINDFISCGNVHLKIMVEKKEKQEMILQKTTFSIDVEMSSRRINITIEIRIEGAQGSHVAELQVIDPKISSVMNIEFKGDQDLIIQWEGVEDIAESFLEAYEVKIEMTVVACNTSTTTIKSVPKLQTSRGKARYQIPMIPIDKNYLTGVSVSIQPVFSGGLRGQVSSIGKRFGVVGRTNLKVVGAILRREITVEVIPSQTLVGCKIKKADFSVIPTDVESLSWNADPLTNVIYKIKDLVPGRNYKLLVKVLYKYGPADSYAEPYVFQTADDVTITKTIHMAEINDRINMSCTVEIGPKDKYQKSAVWLRADKSALPHGVSSILSDYSHGIAYLIVEKTIADYSGEYGCFAIPSADVGFMKITIIVNDLQVTSTEQKADFTVKDVKVSVTCSSSTGDINDLVWTDPLGSSIPDGDSVDYHIGKVVTDMKVNLVTLKIKSVSLALAGTYTCHKSVGSSKAKREFLLYGSEKIDIERLSVGTGVVGEKRRLRCKAQAGLPTQRVLWETYPMSNASYPDPKDTTIQDIDITNSLMVREVKCKLIPASKSDQQPIVTTMRMEMSTKVVVEGPKEVDVGSDVKLMCLGYPSKPDMLLKWMFYPKSQNSTGSVVKTSEGLPPVSSHEPIRLELNMSKIDAVKAGRYECKFNDETRGADRKIGQSISLAVNSVANTVDQGNAGKGGHALTTIGPITTLVVAASVLLLTVLCRH